MFNDRYGLTQAVLAGRKTITRRVATTQKIECPNIGWGIEGKERGKRVLCSCSEILAMSRYAKGEIVAIAQAYKDIPWFSEREEYCRNMPEYTAGWTNKMFVAAKYMPHHIFITEIKVERLQDISNGDCLKEGIDCVYEYPIAASSELIPNGYGVKKIRRLGSTPRTAFAAMIDKISGKGTWASNPWCFCYTFELID